MTTVDLAPAPDEAVVTTAQRGSYLEITWTDPVTGRNGYVVIDRLFRGVSSGGLRVRPGCTLDEVRGLAQGMTRKEALHYQPGARYIPLGGAKGGIDCHPDDPGVEGMLERFLIAVRCIVEQHWTTGEDLGVRQETIDEVCTRIGLTSSVQAVYPLLVDEREAQQRLADAFAVMVGGVALPELVGGMGVAQSALTALAHQGIDAGSARAVIQGFGSMGGATARYLAQAGVRIVGLVDARGTIVNEQGLDVERYLATRSPLGELDRSQLGDGDRDLGDTAWWALDCEVLVPAAVSYCITHAEADEIRAQIIAEAANMPVLPEAEASLRERGVRIVPDFVANSSTNAWWWWTLFGDIEADAEQAERKVRDSMQALVTRTLDEADATGVSPRQAAQAIVDANLRAIELVYGTTGSLGGACSAASGS